MSGQKSEHNSFPSQNTAATATTASSNTSHTRQRILKNFVLIWLDVNVDPSYEECQNTLTQLQHVVNNVNIFTEPNKCADFITELEGVKAFLIMSGTLGQQIISLIHDIPQLHTIYIFGRNTLQHQQWSKAWIKIKRVCTEIASICESLQHAMRQSKQDYIPVSFAAIDKDAANQILNQLEPSFMYTQIFKEILVGMKHN
jgi:hypothetical protein